MCVYVFVCMRICVYVCKCACMRVCMCVCVYRDAWAKRVCSCVYTYESIYIHSWMYICVYVYTFMYICKYVYLYIRLFAYLYVGFVCMCVCLVVCLYVCMYSRVYIYACIHFGTCACTGWRRLIGSPKLQIIFHKRATKYGLFLWKMTHKDKGSYESSPPLSEDP